MTLKLFIFLIFLSTCSAQIKEIKSGSGLFADKMGYLRLKSKEFIALRYVNLTRIYEELETLDGDTKELKITCETIRMKNPNNECMKSIMLLEKSSEDMREIYNNLKYLTNVNRRKRNIFGKFFKFLFGTATMDDIRVNDQMIKQVAEQNKKIAETLNQYMHITEQRFSKFGEKVNQLEAAQQELKTAVKNINKKLEDTSARIDFNSILIEFNAQAEILILYMERVSKKIDTVVQSIMMGKQKIVHPSIMSPLDLYNALKESREYFPEGLKLPVEIMEENMHTLMDASDLIIYQNDGKIIFILKIPLVKDTYDLHQLHSLPLPHEGNPGIFTSIMPTKEYFAASYDGESYIFTDKIMENCKRTSRDEFVCSGLNILSLQDTEECEPLLVRNMVRSIPRSCKVRTIKGNLNIWQSLSSNRWLYTTTEPLNVQINCGGRIKNVTAVNTGVLTLDNDCEADNGLMKLKYTESAQIPNELPRSKIDITKDGCCTLAEYHEKISKMRPLNLTEINNKPHVLSKIEEFNNRLEIMKSKDLEQYNPYITRLPGMNIAIYVVSAMISICFIVFMAMFARFLAKKLIANTRGNQSAAHTIWSRDSENSNTNNTN